MTAGSHAARRTAPLGTGQPRCAVIRANLSNPVLPLTDPKKPMPFPGMSQRTLFGGALPDELNFPALNDMVGRRLWIEHGIIIGIA